MRAFNVGTVSFIVFEAVCYKKEQNFISVQSQAPNMAFSINGIQYRTDQNGRAAVDYSNICAAFDSGTLNFAVGTSTHSLPWQSVRGVRPQRVILPPSKVIIYDSRPFSMTFFVDRANLTLQRLSAGVWSVVSALSQNVISDVSVGALLTNRLRIVDNLGVEYWSCNVVRRSSADFPCEFENTRLMTWEGENGRQKSYYFRVVEKRRRATKGLELARFNFDGFEDLKNWEYGYILQTEKLNRQEREYFADLVLSESVTLWDNRLTGTTMSLTTHQVTISDDNFVNPYDSEFQSLKFGVKFKQYGNI